VYHGFGQAEFAYGALILGSSQFTPFMPLLLLKKDAQFNSGKNRLKNKQLALLILINDTLCIISCSKQE